MIRLPDLRRFLPRARPVEGRRTAPGHPHMVLFRWAGVGVQWLALCSLIAAIIVLIVWIA